MSDLTVSQLLGFLQSHGVTCSDKVAETFLKKIQLEPHQIRALKLLDEHINTMDNFAGSNLLELARTLFDEAYSSIWPFLFKTADSDSCLPNGKQTGIYFEQYIKCIIRNATPSIEYVGSKHPDTDVFVRTNNNMTMSFECKGQSDKTSLRNALDHIKENLATYDIVGAIFRTNAFVPTTRDQSHIVDTIAELPGSNKQIASTVLEDIKTRKWGVFSITPMIHIIILGEKSSKYKLWNGENYKNHGGPNCWELNTDAIAEFVEFLRQILYNKE